MVVKVEEFAETKTKEKENDSFLQFYLSLSIPDKLYFDEITTYQKSCYNSRAVLHKEMVDLGDVNTQDIISKRKAFLQDIDKFTKVVDYLHVQKLQWKETGVN